MAAARGSDQEVAVRIRRIRESLGLTQAQLAEHLGVSFMSVNRWENGHVKPLPAFMKALEKLERETAAQEADTRASHHSQDPV